MQQQLKQWFNEDDDEPYFYGAHLDKLLMEREEMEIFGVRTQNINPIKASICDPWIEFVSDLR